MNELDHHRKIAFVILAAGESKRMGEIKQLLRWQNKSLIEHIIDKALDSIATETFIVLGANAGMIEETISEKPVLIIRNDKWKNGLGSSVSAAANYIATLQESWSGILFSLVDQPLVTTIHFNHLIKTFTQGDAGIVATSNKKGFGVPAIFSDTYFKDLVELCGPGGAKGIIQSNRQDTEFIRFTDSFIDLDTPDDYQEFIAMHP